MLDTCFLLHDHTCLHQFEEYRIALPLTVLEELDTFKVGTESKNFEARQTVRILDELSRDHDVKTWIPIEDGAPGKIRVMMSPADGPAAKLFGTHKNDHAIFDAAWGLQQEEPEAEVVLVTKDINLRLKARALGIPAEDYKNGTIKDMDAIYTGNSKVEGIDADVIRKLYQSGSTRRITVLGEARENNHYYVLRNCTSSALGYFNEGKRCIERVDKAYAIGIKARNAEQAFALHAILNPDIPLVTICGAAGTGKTLLALAGAIEQQNRYEHVLLARPIVAFSNRDLGYLPGDAEEKVSPYMQPLFDNLNFIKGQFGEHERKAIEEMQANGRITISPLANIRGRTIVNTVFIVDEVVGFSWTRLRAS